MSDAPLIKPTIFILYGITGDLAKRKLMPALYNLEQKGHLPENFYIWGTSRHPLDISEYLDSIREYIDSEIDETALRNLGTKLNIHNFDITKEEDYSLLREKIEAFETSKGLCYNLLHYLSVPPKLFGTITKNIGLGALNTGCTDESSARLLIEKPFGFDLESAEELAKIIDGCFTDNQIFRIDHYMGKETIQNILTLRFRNALFRKIWNNDFIQSIDIYAYEEIGVGWRGEFYEQTGAMRDMIQSHLMNLLAVVTMDEPSDLEAGIVQRNIRRVLELMSIDKSREAVRGQYVGYKEEVQNPKSHIETYASVPIKIDDNRWRGVPITLSTGKNLNRKETRVIIHFDPDVGDEVQGNTLEIRIQPDEGISLHVITKKPGLSMDPIETVMEFGYEKDTVFHDAYESVIFYALYGDRLLFPTTKAVLASWHVIQPLLDEWTDDKNLKIYEKNENPDVIRLVDKQSDNVNI